MERLFTVPLKPANGRPWEMYIRGVDQAHRTGSISTDTYFGCFDCAAYAKHTNIRSVRACVKGKEKIRLFRVDADGRQALIGEGNAVTASLHEDDDGYLYMACDGVEQGWPEDIWYEAEGTARPVRLAIVICTYKREDMVRENLSLLSKTIESDPMLRECVEVICVDNGRTLTNVPEGVRLIPNPNYGGSGGYARGMMEAKDSTHLWLMDDDIAFEPGILRRVVTFLKYRKRDTLRLAAGMFSFEQPTIQQEATASFDGYTFHSNCKGLDFAKTASLLGNKIPEGCKNLYGGWWSMVLPNTGELPMPFFIKLDDVEYGLRGQDYATMNGFGVWHEAFGNKGNAWTEYYTTRNTLILQKLHSEVGQSAIKTMGIRLIKSLAYGEPKCMEAALRGVEDYIRGPEAFEQADPEARHMEIMKQYRIPLKSNITRSNMGGQVMRNLLRPSNLRSVGLYLRALRLLKGKRNHDWSNMRTQAFWRDYLTLG